MSYKKESMSTEKPTTVDLFTDVDGPLNFEAPHHWYQLQDEALGDLRNAEVYAHNDRRPYELRWSGEVIHRLNLLVGSHSLEWRYHSTWWEDAIVLDENFGVKTARPLEWDTETGITPRNSFEARGRRKYEALKQHVNHHERPFIWTDDESTVFYKEEDFVVPHLILPVTGQYGILRSHLEAIEAFIREHASPT